MGNTVWVLKEGQEEDDWDHSFILTEEDELKRLSKELGVKKLDELLDFSILSEEFGDVEVEPNYLSPADARPTIESLISAIKSGKGNLESPSEVLEELEDCLSKVNEAEAEKSKIRFSVIP